MLAILAGIGVLCCGAGGIVTYPFFSFGEQVLAADIRSQLQDDPTIKNELGGIESMELNWTASMIHDDEETMVYAVQGSRGKGRLEVRSITYGDPRSDRSGHVANVRWTRVEVGHCHR